MKFDTENHLIMVLWTEDFVVRCPSGRLFHRKAPLQRQFLCGVAKIIGLNCHSEHDIEVNWGELINTFVHKIEN